MQRLESKVLLAGCLVNGILSSIAIAIDIMSVSTAPTLSTSIGMMQNKVKNNSSDSSGKIRIIALLYIRVPVLTWRP